MDFFITVFLKKLRRSSEAARWRTCKFDKNHVKFLYLQHVSFLKYLVTIVEIFCNKLGNSHAKSHGLSTAKAVLSLLFNL
jgi:hypothetical protein